MRGLIQNYFAGREWFCLAFAVIILIWLVAKKKYAGQMKWYFAMPMLLFALICLNPLIAQFLEEKFNLSETYYRLFWIIPFELVLAIAATWMIFRHKKKWVSVLVAVLLVGVVCIAGNSSANELYAKEQSIERVKMLTKQVDDAILADRTDEESVVLYDLDLFLDWRVYDPSILSVMDRAQALGWNVQPLDEEQQQKILNGKNRQKKLSLMIKYGIPLESEQLWNCIDRFGVEYIVVNAPIDLHEYLIGEGMTVIYQNDSVIVYKC